MHVGVGFVFQNSDRSRTDYQVWKDEIHLADLVEPLGYDSVWATEHHFTDYNLSPDVLQFLTYMAGRTRRIQLGSMVVVLPWHDPLRVAEQVSVLDHLSDGRLILGLGRGSGRVEFDAFKLDMADSREIFQEGATMLLEGLETGWCEADGRHVKQPRAAVRPFPFKTFRGRTYVGALSPDTMPIIAKLGAGLFVNPQKPWERIHDDMGAYREAFREHHGTEAPAPIFACWTFVDEDEGRARELAYEHIGAYWNSTLEHYAFHTGHMQGQKGYEYYGKFAETMERAGPEKMLEHFVNLQVWGTPDQCVEKLRWIGAQLRSDMFSGVFSYGGMSREESERNLRLFAAKVLPRLKGE